MGAEAQEIDDRRPDERLVDDGAVLVPGHVAPGPLQHPDVFGLEVGAADVAGELQGPGGVLDDLDGLDVGDVVEEPAVAREDEHGVALHLEELEDPDLVLRRERARDVPGEEGLDGRRRAVEDDLDVVVADPPRVRRVGAQAASRRPPRPWPPASPSPPGAGPATPGSSRGARRSCSRSRSASARRRGRSSRTCSRGS